MAASLFAGNPQGLQRLPAPASPRDLCTNEKFRDRHHSKSEVFVDRGRRHFDDKGAGNFLSGPSAEASSLPFGTGRSSPFTGRVSPGRVSPGRMSPGQVSPRLGNVSPGAGGSGRPQQHENLFAAPPGTWSPLRKNPVRPTSLERLESSPRQGIFSPARATRDEACGPAPFGPGRSAATRSPGQERQLFSRKGRVPSPSQGSDTFAHLRGEASPGEAETGHLAFQGRKLSARNSSDAVSLCLVSDQAHQDAARAKVAEQKTLRHPEMMRNMTFGGRGLQEGLQPAADASVLDLGIQRRRASPSSRQSTLHSPAPWGTCFASAPGTPQLADVARNCLRDRASPPPRQRQALLSSSEYKPVPCARKETLSEFPVTSTSIWKSAMASAGQNDASSAPSNHLKPTAGVGPGTVFTPLVEAGVQGLNQAPSKGGRRPSAFCFAEMYGALPESPVRGQAAGHSSPRVKLSLGHEPSLGHEEAKVSAHDRGRRHFDDKGAGIFSKGPSAEATAQSPKRCLGGA
mmetsp:Transcript_47715/g.103820  ORF Transcript_47715/g.103820 Transcript_47715/m.103820 type:complete len:516 (-) Transcript_47715:202-1749(-)